MSAHRLFHENLYLIPGIQIESVIIVRRIDNGREIMRINLARMEVNDRRRSRRPYRRASTRSQPPPPPPGPSAPQSSAHNQGRVPRWGISVPTQRIICTLCLSDDEENNFICSRCLQRPACLLCTARLIDRQLPCPLCRNSEIIVQPLGTIQQFRGAESSDSEEEEDIGGMVAELLRSWGNPPRPQPDSKTWKNQKKITKTTKQQKSVFYKRPFSRPPNCFEKMPSYTGKKETFSVCLRKKKEMFFFLKYSQRNDCILEKRWSF